MHHAARSPLAVALATLVALPVAAALPAAATERAAELAVELARPHAPVGARVLAQVGSPDPRLKLAPCPRIEAQAIPGAPHWGRTRVQLRCTAGPVPWRISLPVTVQVWAPAWVARTALAGGQVLAADTLQPGVVDWAATTSPPIAPGVDPVARTLARPLAAGEALRESDLRARQWFEAGDTVVVTALGPGFAVKADARALTAGLEGRPATLQNSAGRVFQAQPVGERRAEVRL
jgi:flagellar basal body P-ring formation protein FlgA